MKASSSQLGGRWAVPLGGFPPGGVQQLREVGAVGVSGAAADEDEHCAITAAQAVGLVTEPATSALKAAL